ncbi:uncharacterized protein BKA55DRAFT_98894 [Fusarium redolens]|uniref:Uncharacterized protein n=1 Tax=Fusarium redolens TaxID=48865 RepID=A0A9P9GPV6_FUSRE|nr:uncharacterized protein BKA55DRAFT_98894 [Fusarium redolens]KAH7243543.1 hypothetical protein BKA55DRAFT_98894 [Fusarium redolens]
MPLSSPGLFPFCQGCRWAVSLLHPPEPLPIPPLREEKRDNTIPNIPPKVLLEELTLHLNKQTLVGSVLSSNPYSTDAVESAKSSQLLSLLLALLSLLSHHHCLLLCAAPYFPLLCGSTHPDAGRTKLTLFLGRFALLQFHIPFQRHFQLRSYFFPPNVYFRLCPCLTVEPRVNYSRLALSSHLYYIFISHTTTVSLHTIT